MITILPTLAYLICKVHRHQRSLPCCPHNSTQLRQINIDLDKILSMWRRVQPSRYFSFLRSSSSPMSSVSSSAPRPYFKGSSPNSFKIGVNQPSPHNHADGGKDEFIKVDPRVTGVYGLMTSIIVPRPIALISSLSSTGIGNLAPFSYFNIMGHDPPIVAIGIASDSSKKGLKKDTLVNIEETGEFVINVVSEWFVESANYCSGNFPDTVNEMDVVGLTPIASSCVKSPRVYESAVQMECKVRYIYPVTTADNVVKSTVIIADIVMFHVNENVSNVSPNSKSIVVDIEKLQPMSRLGGIAYGKSIETFDLQRPSIKEGAPK